MKLTQTQLKKMIIQEMKSLLTEAEVNKYESISKKVSDAYRLIVEAHDELRQMKGPKKDIAKLWKLVDSIDNLFPVQCNALIVFSLNYKHPFFNLLNRTIFNRSD